MKVTTRQALKISKLIKKLNLKVTNPNGTQNEIGSDMILQIVSNIGDAEQEVAEVISIITGTSPEEALDIDLIELFEKEKGENGIISFFMSAVKHRMNESSSSSAEPTT